MKQKVAIVLTLVLIAIVLCGCKTKFTLRTAALRPIAERSKVAVTVWDEDVEGHGPCALEGYLTAALVARKYAVRALSLELLVGRAVLKRIMPTEPFSGVEAVIKGMPEGAELEAGDGIINKMFDANELSDGAKRYPFILDLAKRIPTDWDVSYLLVVHRFDTFGYAAYVVNLPSNVIEQVVMISGNKAGFVTALAGPKGGRGSSDSEDGDVSRMEMLRLAEFIADLMRSG